MVTLITGAGGFVGQALVRQAQSTDFPGKLRLVDRVLPPTIGAERVETDLFACDLPAILEDVHSVIHLAALPGGAAEADPELSHRINLELTERFLKAISAAQRPIRFVHASSIAVFGTPLPELVDDDTEPRSGMTYGSHKRMAELAVESSGVDAVSVRLPGVVARPRRGVGFKSAFMSDVFWAVSAGEPCTMPIGPAATMWLMSAQTCAGNLLHAMGCALGQRRVMTLPAIRVTMAELAAATATATGRDVNIVSYAPDPELEEQFGRMPPLATPLARSLGFEADPDLPTLVRSALRSAAA